jgi:hypothetical protein
VVEAAAGRVAGRCQATELLAYVKAIGKEGLDPRDYDPALLEAALKGGDPARSRPPPTPWPLVARDLRLAMSAARPGCSGSFAIPTCPKDAAASCSTQALAGAGIAATLDGLLPTHPQYGSLKNALAKAGQGRGNVGKIRLNMDRWRWLPRDLGSRYIIVNVPGEHATLVENSVTRWKRRAIAGAPRPRRRSLRCRRPACPQPVVGSAAEPVAEVAGKPAMSRSRARTARSSAGASRRGRAMRSARSSSPCTIRRTSTCTTPTTAACSTRSSRFLSHGCIRTEHILDLAAELLSDDGGEWTAREDRCGAGVQEDGAADLREAGAGLHRLLLGGGADRRQHRQVPDLYKRDAPVLAALNDRDGGLKPPVRAAARSVKLSRGEGRSLTCSIPRTRPEPGTPDAQASLSA